MINFFPAIFPRIDLPPQPTAVELREMITLTCNATAKPPPMYIWYKLAENASTRLLENVPVLNETDAVLVFESVGPVDRGVYTCSVSNDLGTNISDPVILSIDGRQ